MKSSKLVSCRRPYCRRSSLNRGMPRSRSRMMSRAATSICCVPVCRRPDVGGQLFDRRVAIRGRLFHQVCRYTLRPPVAQDRLRLTADGQVQLALKRPWSDGTTHLVFDPVELLERLAVLTPRPRINLIPYHGGLAPRAAWRSLVVSRTEAAGPGGNERKVTDTSPELSDGKGAPPCRAGSPRWADLMRRTSGFDVLACPSCADGSV